MRYFGLPKETIAFLKAGQQFAYDPSSCEAGIIKLKQHTELSLGEIYINSNDSLIEAEDPHAGEEGYYLVRAVDLISECKAYGAEGILMWLPDYKVFGQWDCDHWDVMIFPRATWADLVADPARYLGAGWVPDLEIGEHLKPWGKSKFNPGRPLWLSVNE